MIARKRPELDERFRRSKLHKYLLADEVVLIAQRQHWAALWKTIAIGVGGLFLVLVLNLYLPPSALTDLLWWALLALAIWAALKWFEWRRSWMVATDKRVMVNHGLIHQGVAMFSLSRVPDLTYTRSSLGQLLGYGELQRESTGIGQTLHKVRFVEHPHATYTTLCAAIFDLQDRMFGMDEEDEHDHRLENTPPEHTPGLHAPYVPQGERPVTTHVPEEQVKESAESVEEAEEPVVRVHYGVSNHHRWESPYQSSDLRDTDTGPVPYRRPTTDEGPGWQPTSNDPDPDH